MSTRPIAGAHVLVTGASSGIGQALARNLLRQGAHVLATARREDRLHELAASCTDNPARLICLAGDITDASLRDRLMRAVHETWGRLDILVNNAGVGAIGPFSRAPADRLRRVMEVNFFAPAELTRIALPMLRAGQRPLIVNIGSVLGHRAVPHKSEYCASKFALHGLSDSLRAELAGEGIDLLLVSPSTTRSEFTDHVLGANPRPARWQFGSLSAEQVAARAIHAMRRGRHEVILSPGGKLLVWLDRLSPPLLNRLIARFGPGTGND
ncbi:MAG: SDR family NAD(P)-dependent oxidoreductase [Pirellulaceae bacterium]